MVLLKVLTKFGFTLNQSHFSTKAQMTAGETRKKKKKKRDHVTSLPPNIATYKLFQAVTMHDFHYTKPELKEFIKFIINSKAIYIRLSVPG